MKIDMNIYGATPPRGGGSGKGCGCLAMLLFIGIIIAAGSSPDAGAGGGNVCNGFLVLAVLYLVGKAIRGLK